MAKIAFSSKKENGLGGRPIGSRQVSGSEQEEIAKLAYQFFSDRGYEHGHDQEDWIRAEAIIRRRRSS